MTQQSSHHSVPIPHQESVQVNSHDERTDSELQATSNSKRETPKLSLQIPSKPVIFTTLQDDEGSHQSQVAPKGASSSAGSFLHAFSFKNKAIPSNGEKNRLLNSNSEEVAASPTFSRVMSKFRPARCASLPRPMFESPPSVATPASARTAGEHYRPYKGVVNKSISRSFSVPGRNVVIVRSPSLGGSKGHYLSNVNNEQVAPASLGCDNDEEIPEDEAICRICFEDCEEGNTLKMECSCKGALQLIHEDCAVKWFSTRKNKNCDVCGQEVLNLPVTLLRVPSATDGNNGQVQNLHTVNLRSISSAWQDFVVLLLISSICYFFFLEQLLIQDLKTRAIMIAAPFAFTLGLTASVLAVTLAIKEYIWTFAAVEFAFVAIILCLFYNVLHLNAVYSLLISSMLGFSIALCLNTIYIHAYYWRISPADNSSNV